MMGKEAKNWFSFLPDEYDDESRNDDGDTDENSGMFESDMRSDRTGVVGQGGPFERDCRSDGNERLVKLNKYLENIADLLPQVLTISARDLFELSHRNLIIPRWLTSNHRPIYKVKPRYLLPM